MTEDTEPEGMKLAMITTIVFDIGGVFLHPAKELSNEFWRRNGVLDSFDSEGAAEVMYGELWEVYKRGGMTEEEYWKAIRATLPVKAAVPWTALRNGYELCVTLDDELVDLARGLKQTYRIHALSNAGAELERRLHHFDINDLFDEVINSHYVKMAKPDEEIYAYTSTLIKAKPDEILFVDDKPRNTIVAAQMGFQTHVYSNASSFKIYLQEQSLLEDNKLIG